MATLIKTGYCCILLAFLLLPSLGMLLDFEDYPSCEKRELKAFPEFQFSKSFLNEFEDYYNDHFSFRNQLNHWNAYLKYTFFNSSPKPQDAVIGQDDWLYYVTNNALPSFARTNLLNQTELAEEVQTWSKRKAKLDSLGIRYFQAVYPNKSTIYPAPLPPRMALQKKDTLSKIDQVLQYLKNENIPLHLIDVREALVAQKNKQRIYHKHDTHWNSFGAFFAYQQVMQTMGITPYQLSDFDITWEETTKGDLLEIAGLCNSDQIKENQPIFTLKDKDRSPRKVEANWMRRMENDFTDSEEMIIVFRDSYTTALLPFIALHFRQSNFIWSDYDQKFVDDMKPDVVLVGKVERYF